MRKWGAVLVLILGATATVLGQSGQTPKMSLVGSWVKQRTRQEDHTYPDDKDWKLTVVFQADGRFLWKAKRQSPPPNDGGASEAPRWIDESVAGTYSVEGALITYKFDKPSPEALKQLPEFFAFWPKQLRGQQTFRFQDAALVLGHDGHKTWVYLAPEEKKVVEPTTPADGAQPAASPPPASGK